MRKSVQKLVLSFSTTTDAMAAEEAVRSRALDGRLIPVPRKIRAGCGMALMAAPSLEKELLQILEELGIQLEAVTVMDFLD